MIPHEDDPSLRARHGNQQIEGVRPRRLVDDDGAEHRVVSALGVRHGPADRLLAGRREHHRIVLYGFPDPGGVILKIGEPLGGRDVRTGGGLPRPHRQRIDHAIDHGLHVDVDMGGDSIDISGTQPIDQRVPDRLKTGQQRLVDRRFGIEGGGSFEA